MYIDNHHNDMVGFGSFDALGRALGSGGRTCFCGLVALISACTTAPAPPAIQGPHPAPDPIPITVAKTLSPVTPTENRRENSVDPPAIREGRSIFFAKGSAELNSNAHAVLETHAARLNDDPKLVVTLVGHSDHLGSRSYNLAVAEQRVATVAKALRMLRVQRSQIRRYSLGNENPGVQCQNEACRSKLRRVDLVYSSQQLERRVGMNNR